ncbi:MAG: PKD-like domain-containing protein, partial [Ferruginibacter sp.]
MNFFSKTHLIGLYPKNRIFPGLKKYFIIVMGLLYINTAVAQTLAADYQFATSSTAYTPLSGATTLIAGTNTGVGTFNDAATAGPTNIGFTFRFNCLSYTQFSVTPNGYLILGGGAITTNFNNDLATAGNYPVIAPWWDHQHLYDNGGAGNGCTFNPVVGVLYQLNGTAPNRILTIEFNTQVTDNTNAYWWAGCGLSMNRYQVRLYEGTNRIQFHYGSLWASSGQPTSATIGIANSGSNFLSVTPTGGTGTVSSVTSNNAIFAHVALIPGSTVYNFTPCYFNLIGNGVDAPVSMAPGDILLSNITNACGSNTTYSPFTVNFPAGTCPSHNYTLSITGPSATEYEFTATNNQTQAGTLAAGATITPSIRFIPNGVGVRNATLTFTDNSIGCSTIYNLAGNAPTPTAVATPSTQTSCSGDPIATIVMTGTATSYDWVRDNTANVTGIAANGSGNISGSLTNTTNAPITVTFTITPMAGSCAGTPITATVVVNPKPYAAASPASQTSCSNSPITPIVLTSVFPSNLVVGLNFSATWADEITLQLVDASSNTVLAAGPFGGFSTYTSPSIPAVNGPYTFNIQAGCGSCDNYSAFTINCNASTIASGCIRAASGPACANTGSFSVPGLICSGAGVSGVVFNWVRDNPGVTGMPTSGTTATSISGTLINSTASPILVTFTITPTYTNAGVTCAGTPITATVTVNPLPAATIIYAGTPYCSNAG